MAKWVLPDGAPPPVSAPKETNFFEELNKLIEEYPDLVFDNDGYQNIPDDVRQKIIDGHNAVEALLKVAVRGFVRFQNFKPRKNGGLAVRCQTKWSEGFTGVSYFPLENFQPNHPSWS